MKFLHKYKTKSIHNLLIFIKLQKWSKFVNDINKNILHIYACSTFPVAIGNMSRSPLNSTISMAVEIIDESRSFRIPWYWVIDHHDIFLRANIVFAVLYGKFLEYSREAFSIKLHKWPSASFWRKRAITHVAVCPAAHGKEKSSSRSTSTTFARFCTLDFWLFPWLKIMMKENRFCTIEDITSNTIDHWSCWSKRISWHDSNTGRKDDTSNVRIVTFFTELSDHILQLRTQNKSPMLPMHKIYKYICANNEDMYIIQTYKSRNWDDSN